MEFIYQFPFLYITKIYPNHLISPELTQPNHQGVDQDYDRKPNIFWL